MKSLRTLLSTSLLLCLCLLFTACPPDPDPVPETYSIVGNWKYSFSSDSYVLFILKSDGNCRVLEWDKNQWDSNESGTWTYEGTNEGILILRFFDYVETIHVDNLSKDKFIAKGYDGGDQVFYRYTGEIPNPTTPSYSVSVNPSTISLDSDGGSRNIQITSNSSWSISNIPSWITVTPTNGNGNQTVVVKVSSNSSSSSREASIRVGLVQSDSEYAYFTVSQNGKETPSTDYAALLKGTTWENYSGGYRDLIVFDSDGNSGFSVVTEDGVGSEDGEQFTYSVSSNQITLTSRYNQKTYTGTISVVNDNQIRMSFSGSAIISNATYTKVTNILTSKNIVGTWKCVDKEEEVTITYTFKSTGKGTCKIKEDGETDTTSFNWTIAGNVIVMWDVDYPYSEPDAITVLSYTSSQLKIVDEYSDEDEPHIYKKS